MDCSLPGSFVHGILQARILQWGCHALLQVVFPTQGSNPRLFRLLHWQAGSLPLAPPGPQQALKGQVEKHRARMSQVLAAEQELIPRFPADADNQVRRLFLLPEGPLRGSDLLGG